MEQGRAVSWPLNSLEDGTYGQVSVEDGPASCSATQATQESGRPRGPYCCLHAGARGLLLLGTLQMCQQLLPHPGLKPRSLHAGGEGLMFYPERVAPTSPFNGTLYEPHLLRH